MKRIAYLLFFTLIVSSLLIFIAPAHCGPFDNDTWQIYVRNKLFNAPVIINKGAIFVPASDFIKALRFSYTQSDDGVIHISSNPGDCPNINFSGGTLWFEYSGNKFNLPYIFGKSRTYVDIKRFSLNLGVSYLPNTDTMIVDIVVPQGMSAKQFEKEKNQREISGAAESSDPNQTNIGTKNQLDKGPTMTGTGDSLDPGPKSGNKLDPGPQEDVKTSTGGEPMTKQGQQQASPNQQQQGKPEESPVKQVGNIGGFADSSTGQCWWNVTIKNTGDQVVNNVVLTLHIKDGTGKDFATQIKPIGNMNPGDISKSDFYWQGMKKLNVFPSVEIKHDPIPKKENVPDTTQQNVRKTK